MKKQCSKCKRKLPSKSFYRLKIAKSGLRSWCKDCEKEYKQSLSAKIADKKWRNSEKGKRYRKEHYSSIRGILAGRFYEMRRRCQNKNNINYKYYGGRGIKCLFKSANEFVDYAINELKADPRRLQIDRINNDGHYEPGNIRFVTQIENLKNRS